VKTLRKKQNDELTKLYNRRLEILVLSRGFLPLYRKFMIHQEHYDEMCTLLSMLEKKAVKPLAEAT